VAWEEQAVYAASQSDCLRPLAKTVGPCTTRVPRPKLAKYPTRLGQQGVKTDERSNYLIQGMRDAVSALRNIQREHFTRVDDERDHARCDENRDENRRYWVETCPTIVLYE
jgi:hypothetical protein